MHATASQGGRLGGVAVPLRILGNAGAIALNLLGELIAPSRCAACDAALRRSSVFCGACASTVEHASESGGACVAAFEYGGAIATAIGRLKYEDRADLAARLARAMTPAVRRFEGAVDVVVPVPLHPRRLAERGYNQAALLATPIARMLGVSSGPRALARVRDTPRQVGMDRERRRINVAGAFAARELLVRGARILLVDDVLTTGATLDGCVRALHEVGAREVRALVFARRA